MAIRLIDQYPNRAGVPNADYPHGVPRNKSTPTSTDGTPFEQAWFRDQEGFFQGLLETAGVTPSGSPDTVEQSDYFDALVSAMHGVTEVDVGGVGDVTLGIYPSRVAALRLTGTLGADVDLIVPDTERLYTIINETSGGFSVTVRTSAGSGVIIGEAVSVVRCDGTNVVGANPASDLGQNIAVFDTAGVTEWTVPDVLRQGLRKAHVTVIGAGGGGGGTAAAGAGEGASASGGAGGETRLGILDLTGDSSISITVGAGGAGGAAGNNNGSPGASSSFGSYITSVGGALGLGSPSTSGTNRINGGFGGSGGAGGDVAIKGGDGGNGMVSSSSFFSYGNGGDTYMSTITRQPIGADGFSAGGYGGGGSGATTNTANSRSGGDGADGIVIVRW